jgi:hypothetical protein
LYARTLPDQWIDITGLAPGDYWLESVVDPENHIEEVNEGNNIAYYKLTIAPGELPVPDEIPASRGLPKAAALVLLLASAGILALRARTRGIPRL